MDAQSSPAEHFLHSALATLHTQKRMAEAAIRQLDNDRLHRPLDANTNSVAVIMKHMTGNMLSRWTNFLTSDGEEPSRARDGEFIDDIASRDELMARWERGWKCLFDALAALGPGDSMHRITIRGHPHTVIEAVHRQIDHYGYHVGQIVQLACFLAKDNWEILTIPRGEFEAYNLRTWKK